MTLITHSQTSTAASLKFEHGSVIPSPLHWRHNDQDGVSNHQPHGCLLKRLFKRRSKKASKLRVTGLCMGNSPGPVNSPHKGPVTRKMFPFGDFIMHTCTVGVITIQSGVKINPCQYTNGIGYKQTACMNGCVRMYILSSVDISPSANTSSVFVATYTYLFEMSTRKHISISKVWRSLNIAAILISGCRPIIVNLFPYSSNLLQPVMSHMRSWGVSCWGHGISVRWNR